MTQGVTVADALGAVTEGAVGYVSGPEAVRWFRRPGDGGRHPEWGPGESEPSSAFELVAFDGATVWHWVRDGAADGRLTRQLVSQDGDDVREERALLSGQCQERSGDWSLLQDQRGARYWLPLPLDARGRAVLVRAEVLDMDEWGNVRVAAVRPRELKKVEVAK